MSSDGRPLNHHYCISVVLCYQHGHNACHTNGIFAFRTRRDRNPKFSACVLIVELIPTGLQKIDRFLSGGIPDGVITDIFGENGTGKTQMLLQLAAGSIMDGGRVLYLDTTGGFRPERILNIRTIRDSVPDVLDRITVSRIINTSEQVRAVQNLRGGTFSLIVIDNITDLFSYEYKEKVHEKNILFMRHMHELSRFSTESRIPVVVTNMIRMFQDREVENMKAAIDPFTHIKIHLSRRRRAQSGFRGRIWWAMAGMDFSYMIHASGISEDGSV